MSVRITLPAVQALALTSLDLPGAFHIISTCFKDEPQTQFNLVFEARP